MIKVGMGHDDVADMLIRSHRAQDRVEVVGLHWPGINDRKRLIADQIGVGAAVGHGRGVRRHDAAQTGFKRLCGSDWRVEVIGWSHGLAFRMQERLCRV